MANWFKSSALAGVASIMVGGVLGAATENALQVDRELRRDAFEMRKEALRLFTKGRTSGTVEDINNGRYLIALYGSPELKGSVRDWMTQEINVATCDPSNPEFRFYVDARKELDPEGFSVFESLTGIKFREEPPREIYGEVATRCLLAK